MSLVPETGVFGEELFQPFVSVALPTETLEQLTNDSFYATKHPDETGLMKRIREAWTKPVQNLTCAEVDTLVLQKLGLEWLAKPVLELVTAYPTIECGAYPGDLSVASLLAWRQLHAFEPDATKRFIQSDFAFLRDDPDAEVSISIIKHGVDALNEAEATLLVD